MMLRWNLKALMWLASVCAALMLLLFAAITFAIEPEWSKRFILCGLSLFFVGMGILEMYLLWRDLERCGAELARQIDGMLKGNPVDFFFHAPGSPVESVHTQFMRLSEILEVCMADSKSERDEIQSLISDIAHQAKTPIANIKVYTSILLDRETSAQEHRVFLSTIDRQTEKLAFLLESLVKMSQLETGIIQIRLQDAPIHATIADALYAIAPKAKAKQIALSLECDDSLIVRHDTKWTAEALHNLLDNAVKYTPGGGSVAVRVHQQRHLVTIDVEDTGIGIEPERQETVFNRFYRTADIQGEEGIGIGLFLARKIIAQQGGAIQLRSQPGVGSVFTVMLEI